MNMGRGIFLLKSEVFIHSYIKAMKYQNETKIKILFPSNGDFMI